MNKKLLIYILLILQSAKPYFVENFLVGMASGALPPLTFLIHGYYSESKNYKPGMLAAGMLTMLGCQVYLYKRLLID